MTSDLILYSTTDGHTRKIAQYLADQMQSHGRHCELFNIEDALTVNLNQYDGIVIAASIRYGRFARLLRSYVDKHASVLNSKKTAFLSVNLIARKPEKRSPETNVYTRKFLRKTKWKPATVCVVAGMLDYPKYGFWDRNIIRFIMKITGGPTDPATTTEFTDWSTIRKFVSAWDNGKAVHPG